MRSPQRVLIVQHDARAAQLLIGFFRKRGDQVWEAWELGQAQALFTQVKPHLLLFDLHLPEEDWIQFLRTAREKDAKLKVILTNQVPDLQREVLAISSGFNIILRQPFQPRWINSALQRAAVGADSPSTSPTMDADKSAPDLLPGGVRIPLRIKLILPFVLVSALLAGLGSFFHTPYQTGLYILAGVLLTAAVGLLTARAVSRPIKELTDAFFQVSQGNLGVKVNLAGKDEIAGLGHSFNAMIASLQEENLHRDLYARLLTSGVREQLRHSFANGEIRLEGQQLPTSVVAIDLRSFNTHYDQVPAPTLIHWLNEYYEHILPPILANGGVVTKMDGPALQVIFGILPRPSALPASCAAACQAAAGMLTGLDKLNQLRQSRGEPPLVLHAGIQCGEVIAGGLSAGERLHFAIMGDPIQAAQRLQSMAAQVLKTSGVLLSQNAYSQVQTQLSEFSLDPFVAPGANVHNEKPSIYQLKPRREPPRVDVML